MLLRISPSAIRLHWNHPAAKLVPVVRDRLLNQTLELDALRQIATIETCHVVAHKGHYWLIAGWHIWATMRQHKIDDPISCRVKEGLTPREIEKLGRTDFLRFHLFSCDEVARRLLAILELQDLGDLSRRKLKRIKAKYAIPTRKRDTLNRLLENEHEQVWSMIMDAPKPIGGKNTQHPSVFVDD